MDANQSRKAIFALEDRIFVQILQKMLETVCLSVPNLYSYKALPVWYIFYAGLFIVLFNVAFVLQISSRIQTYFQRIPKTAVGLESISFTGMTFTNTLSIIYAIFLRRSHIVRLVKKRKEVEKFFRERFCAIDKKENAFSKMFIVTHLYFGFYFVLDCCVYISVLGFGITAYCMTYFNIYMLCLSVLQICSHALYIKYRAHYLNLKMQEFFGAGITTCTNDELSREAVENLRIFMKIFDRLCDAIETVNKCFGVQIVLIVCNSIAHIILGLNLCFKIILNRTGPEFGGFAAYLTFVNMWCSLLFVVSKVYSRVTYLKMQVSIFFELIFFVLQSCT